MIATTVRHYARAYARALVGRCRYAASERDLKALFKEARSNPYDHTLHGAIADALEEHHGGPLPDLIRKQFGLGQHSEPSQNLWHEPVQNAWDGTFPYAARLGSHGPFSLYLAHEGQSSDRFDPAAGSNQRWVVHAVSRLPGSKDFGYSFEFPHSEAHLIPQLFPAAAKHIDSNTSEKWKVLEHGRMPQELTNAEYRQHEADLFDDKVDEEERSRE